MGQPPPRSGGALAVTLEPIADPRTLEADWTDLERRSEHSFFQSWGWIGCWLRQLPVGIRPQLLRVGAEGRSVGLAVFCERHARRRGLIAAHSLHLNETGDPRLDELTIEHNGLLAETTLAPDVWRAALAFLAEGLRAGRWDEAYLPGVSPEIEALAADLPRPLQRRKAALCHLVDLAALRAAGGDYLQSLGKKTRQHLRRTLRRYAERGPLAVTAAGSGQEAQDFLTALIELHQADWRARGAPGAFADPWIVDFHRALVEARFDAGEIQLLRVAAGDWVVGYLYHFVQGGRVYSYQWGLAAESDPAIAFGLAADYLAVLHNLEAGAAVFDFLHGDSLHKRRLGTASETRVWLVMQRPRWDFRLENRLRAWRRRYSALTSSK